MVGDGARRWASDHDIEVCHPDGLLTQHTKEVYVDHMERLEKCSGSLLSSRSGNVSKERQLDTVGAVGVDSMGNVCAACSSGGISLKYPGRIGQVCDCMFVWCGVVWCGVVCV